MKPKHLTIRELTPNDAEQFRRLRREAVKLSEDGFASAMDEWESKSLTEIRELLEDEFTSPNDFILGAFSEDKLVGMIGFFRLNKPTLERRGHIWGTFLLPEFRHAGTAGKLLDELIRRAKRMHQLDDIQIVTLNHSKSTVILYRSRGFRVFATEKEAVRMGDHSFDELYMTLSLREAQ